ncbi:hypothetical protein [Peribacillus frigoritolerans]|uniref:hypothetical protein n=1 Tax=Peribacillus frigoritolerans TaxID=450367 RepID=UPI0020406E22|nr:hypothetical protein [Peribacillus frigoritolerans]MCM3167117.1 hypothetical protein [Peribacillus frigoritolerans]
MSKSQAGEAGSSKSFIRKGALVKEGLLSLATKGVWSPNKGNVVLVYTDETSLD